MIASDEDTGLESSLRRHGFARQMSGLRMFDHIGSQQLPIGNTTTEPPTQLAPDRTRRVLVTADAGVRHRRQMFACW